MLEIIVEYLRMDISPLDLCMQELPHRASKLWLDCLRLVGDLKIIKIYIKKPRGRFQTS